MAKLKKINSISLDGNIEIVESHVVDFEIEKKFIEEICDTMGLFNDPENDFLEFGVFADEDDFNISLNRFLPKVKEFFTDEENKDLCNKEKALKLYDQLIGYSNYNLLFYYNEHILTNEEKDKLLLMNGSSKITGYSMNYEAPESDNIIITREEMIKHLSEKPVDYYDVSDDFEFCRDLEDAWENFLDDYMVNNDIDSEIDAIKKLKQYLIDVKVLEGENNGYVECPECGCKDIMFNIGSKCQCVNCGHINIPSEFEKINDLLQNGE